MNFRKYTIDYMKKKIPKYLQTWRLKFVKQLYRETDLSYEEIGRIFCISKQAIQKMVKKR